MVLVALEHLGRVTLVVAVGLLFMPVVVAVALQALEHGPTTTLIQALVVLQHLHILLLPKQLIPVTALHLLPVAAAVLVLVAITELVQAAVLQTLALAVAETTK
jgi:hypothetical protein